MAHAKHGAVPPLGDLVAILEVVPTDEHAQYRDQVETQGQFK